MSLPVSARQTVRHVPIACSPEARAVAEAAGETDLSRFDSPPAYILQVPTLMRRAAFRRDVRASGGIFHTDEVMLAELRRQVAAAFDDGDVERDRLLGLIDDYRAQKDPPDELKAEIQRLEKIVIEASSEYAAMLAARHHWQEVAPIIACMHFLKARENPDRIFRRRHDLVLESELETIPDGELLEVGYRILGLMQPSAAQEKNSASPSQSSASPTISPAESERPTDPDGSSSDRSTSETPAST